MLTLANGQQFNPANLIATTAAPTKSKFNSMVVWEGASLLDGQPIAAIATLNSSNTKTGNMVQIAIIRADIRPTDAVKTGDDASVCGSCPHRHFNASGAGKGGSCYVNVGHGPLAVFGAYKRGNVMDFNIDAFRGRMVRFGSYGDPAAVPPAVFQAIADVAKGFTGYTHQINHKNFDHGTLNFCQVSADTEKQALKFQATGAKTFRVKHITDPLLAGEIECLADTIKLNCIDCGLCNGKQTNVAINVHGARANRFKG